MTYDESKCKKNGAVYLLKNPESLLESSVSEKRSLSRKNHDDVEEFSKKTKVVSTLATNGTLNIPFCMGKKEYCHNDPLRAVYGNITSMHSTQCDGVVIPAVIPHLTLGSLLYTALGNNENALQILGPFKGIGVKDATIELTATTSYVKLAARGSPMITPNPGNIISEFLTKATESFVLEMSATFLLSGTATLEMRGGLKPIRFSTRLLFPTRKERLAPVCFLGSRKGSLRQLPAISALRFL